MVSASRRAMCNQFERAMLRRTRGTGGQIPPACPSSGHGGTNHPRPRGAGPHRTAPPTSRRMLNPMLPANSTTAPKREPHVAVCVDKAHAYGRGILMGLADYMDMFGRWSLY